jgi:hypothetical protein
MTDYDDTLEGHYRLMQDEIRKVADEIAYALLPAVDRAKEALLCFVHELHVGWMAGCPSWRRLLHVMAIGAHLAHRGRSW